MYKREEGSESDDDLDEFEASADDSSRRKQVRQMPYVGDGTNSTRAPFYSRISRMMRPWS